MATANRGQLTENMNRAIPLTALLLLTGGLCLIGWLAWNQYSPLKAPYAYSLVENGPIDDFPDFGLSLVPHPNLVIQRYELRAEGEAQPLVVLHTAKRDRSAAVLLDWKADFSEPLIHMATDIGETDALAKAIRQHAPRDSLLLAWWDVSRRLKLLTGNDVLFDQNLAQPLMLPATWIKYQAVIGSLENSFWDIAETSKENRYFGQFVEAMLADKSSGIAKLKELAGKREAYLVVDIRDAYKLGNLYPDRFGIGFKDFPRGGDVHGSAGSIKSWLHDQGYEDYAIQPMKENLLRVYFFTDKKSHQTLFANLLPFTTSNPVELKELELVYQHKSYWIYRLNTGDEGMARANPKPPAVKG